MVKATGGRWDRTEWPLYFAAANIETLEKAKPCTDHILVAVNELDANRIGLLNGFLEAGRRVFVDSGVYNLATQHAKNHLMSMDEALGLAPAAIDGFDALFKKYVAIMQDVGSHVWGYIEIDQGGMENKIKTRAKLEALGLSPIPVYHPLNDGWDYFDYLATRYDRICFGNVVMADGDARKRLIATAWERRRKYPDLWIHALGMTPSETTTAFPLNSCDSSTWIGSLRWGQARTLVANSAAFDLGKDFVYDVVSDDRKGRAKAAVVCGYEAVMVGRIGRQIMNDQRGMLGADPVVINSLPLKRLKPTARR